MARKIEIGFDRYFKRPWMDYYFNLMAAGTDPKQVRELFLDFLMKEAGRRHGGGHWNLCEKDERNLSNPIPPNEEYKAFQSFLGRMDELRAEFGDEGFIIFHYAHYEPRTTNLPTCCHWQKNTKTGQPA
ncbi:MAG: hypothetical protein B6240_08370 [Desulfobacteraceae bacterium 4572_87]|nr:MAG: hypothetical protein B6240_08370 [Desulfobacteraceae bacterium 4572_87]